MPLRSARAQLARAAGDRAAAGPDRVGRVGGGYPHPAGAGAGRRPRGGAQHAAGGRPRAGPRRAAGAPPGLGHVRRRLPASWPARSPAGWPTPTLAEVVEVRRALEVEAARSAARRRTDDDLAALDAALADREAAWAAGDRPPSSRPTSAPPAVVAAAHNRHPGRPLRRLLGRAALQPRPTSSDRTLTQERYADHARLSRRSGPGTPTGPRPRPPPSSSHHRPPA